MQKNLNQILKKVDDIEGLLVPGQERILVSLGAFFKGHPSIVEIGSYLGKSTVCFGLGSADNAKIYSIDTFAGNEKDFIKGKYFKENSFLNKFNKNISKFGVDKKVKPVVGYSQEIGKKWNKKMDLLFIDGSHIYKDVKQDFELYFKWLKPGGIIAFHDVSKGHPGVYRVWHQIAKKKLVSYGNISTLYFGFKKGKQTKEYYENKIQEILGYYSNRIFIIIPVFNRLGYTIKCLDSIEKQTYKNYEVILVDDGSTDGTSKYIRKHYPYIKIIKGNGHWWWTKSVKVGVEYSLGKAREDDCLLTLNNDCILDQNFLKNILRSSQENGRSIVGSLILDAENKNRVLDAGVKIAWGKGLIYGVADKISSKIKFYSDRKIIKDLDTLPGKGTLIPVEVFRTIGNFNYILLPHYIADYEFFCRAKKFDFNLIVSSSARLYNFSMQTGYDHLSGERASYHDVFRTLFSRKSKLNIVDQLFFLILCCPNQYLYSNTKKLFWKFIGYLFMTYPFFYVPRISRRLRLTAYRLKLYVIQNKYIKIQNPKNSVSYGYRQINKNAAKKLSASWLKRQLPARQMKIVSPLLKQNIVPLVAMPVINILKKIGDDFSILDVGCSGGYYLDFFKNSKINVSYEGCDFSPHFIKLAKKLHPETDFRLAKITELPYKNKEFEVVLASGILEFVIDYKKAIKELTRVSSRYIIIHRLPVFNNNESTKYFSKLGYEIEMMEIVFSMQELNKIFSKNGLQIKEIKNNYSYDLNLDGVGKINQTTILLEKNDN